jgi:cytochrome c-type biogenesis protein CcsB
MSNMVINTQIANLSFFLLLVAMISYWLGPLSRDLVRYGFSSEFDKKKGTQSVTSDILSLPLALSVKKPTLPSFFFPITPLFQKIGHLSIFFTTLLLTFLLCNRWIESGHFPVSNLYESLLFLSWGFTVIHLFFEKWTSHYRKTSQDSLSLSLTERESSDSDERESFTSMNYIGAITTPRALFTNAFATFSLPKEMQMASSLVPALQSNWLMMHVTVMILSYAALLLGSLLAIAFLILTLYKKEKTLNKTKKTIFREEKKTEVLGNTLSQQETVLTLPQENNIVAERVSFLPLLLDNLSYRIIGIGFPFLTLGILSGAVWANEAWGSYWSWDPKETWALLTWLIYAIYLHTRLNKGWEGKKPALIASFGFSIVWICYLGVNFLGEGLHSYGWFSTNANS